MLKRVEKAVERTPVPARPQKPVLARPQKNVDREALRAAINERFSKTLDHLAR